MTKQAELRIGDKIVELPVYDAALGPSVIDITKLYNETGYFTYDPGFMSTASCSSSITYIDGEKGVLKYRGYDISYLAENYNFLQVAYLLLFGELPEREQYAEFDREVRSHSMMNEQLKNIFQSFRYSAHPMSMMLSAVGSLSSIYHEELDYNNLEDRKFVVIRMLAKIPTIAAMAYKYSIGQPFIYPDNSLSFTENFLHMMFATPCEKYKVNPVMSRALDKIFIFHADHEQNASTSTMRIVGSSGANPFACMSAAIASLWGPAHGGANEAVLEMLKTIGTVDRIPEFIARAKDKNDPFRLMGFGHRVYKNYDPRAAALKKICDEVLSELGQTNNPLLQVAKELEIIALNDDYFVERKLYPNVDYYSGIIYSSMGISEQMFTVLFAVARTVGWMSQWKEMYDQKSLKISRPRQLYTGIADR